MKKYFRLLLSLLFLSLSCLILEQTKQLSEKEHYDIMLTASQKTQAAFSAIQLEKISRGFPISSEDDPNHTGLIGESFSEITTTLGNLESKRSTTNPNVSAMIVDMLIQCGVKKGDPIAVNFSGSFPAMDIAVLCAMDSMELNGTVISSVGASTYGGNIPDFTYLDMEHFLFENGYVTNHSSSFSMGGIDDLGKEMPEHLRTNIQNRLQGYGLNYLCFEDINENIDIRTSLYEQNNLPVCFINAGGNLLSFGGGSEMISAKNGIIPAGTESKNQLGLIPHYLSKGVPVIHLLNMKSLLPSYGLPIDPIPLPQAGEGGVYMHYQYNLPLALVLLLLNVSWLLWVAKKLPHRRFPL